MATNFTAGLVIAAEALWLIYLYVADRDARSDDAAARSAQPWMMGAALIAAMVLLLPFFAGLRYGVEGVARGDYDWIQPAGAMGAIGDVRERAWQLAVPAVCAVRDRGRRSAVALESG